MQRILRKLDKEGQKLMSNLYISYYWEDKFFWGYRDIGINIYFNIIENKE